MNLDSFSSKEVSNSPCLEAWLRACCGLTLCLTTTTTTTASPVATAVQTVRTGKSCALVVVSEGREVQGGRWQDLVRGRYGKSNTTPPVGLLARGW
ncbi:hypothetical protein E2C01_058820 [Portunus trituberculatus]|uniref:Uncharacterized protein n=1 Tax=Portunus trituberculatus TaxID=210409 RepID=A0A5B7GXF9_PORTR|nr:hypothetical protein [Portunus trituberculatus]